MRWTIVALDGETRGEWRNNRNALNAADRANDAQAKAGGAWRGWMPKRIEESEGEKQVPHSEAPRGDDQT